MVVVGCSEGGSEDVETDDSDSEKEGEGAVVGSSKYSQSVAPWVSTSQTSTKAVFFGPVLSVLSCP